ncbi:MAG: DUF3717 domain-containing protein [Massilia sp.]
MDLHLHELESAINYWREQCPAHGTEMALSPEVKILATIYALMIFRGADTIALEQLNSSARQLVQGWRAFHLQTSPAS